MDLTRLESDLLALVRERLLDLPAGFGPSSRLADAGLDSMAVMQLLLLVEDRFGIWLPEADLLPENLETVRAFAHVLARRLDESESDACGSDRAL
jgi:acyl carrier protein